MFRANHSNFFIPYTPSQTLQQTRERILQSLIGVIVLLGGLAVIVATVEHFLMASYVAPVIYVILYASVVIAAIRRNMPYRLRAGIALFLILGCAISEYVFWGMTGLSYMAMYSFVVFAGLFFGLRPGMAALALTLLLMGGQFMLYEVQVGTETTMLEYFLGWLAPTLVYCFLVASVLIATNYMLSKLEENYSDARALVDKLTSEVAEHKKTGEALKKSEELYRLLAENSRDVIWTSDLKGHITFLSPSIERLTGFTVDEFPKEQFGMSWDPAQMEHTYNLLERELALEGDLGGDPNRVTVTDLNMLHKDGSLIDVEVLSSFIRDADGTVIGILGAARDVRERKRLEHQLYQAQKMEAVGQLAGGVAHDFNNLLQVIHGFSEMILDDLDSPSEASQQLRHVLDASQRARDLVSQLLAFSRQQVLRLEPVHLGTVVIELSAMIERLIGENIQISCRVEDNLSSVNADRGQLEQVVLNLCVNARDAMGKSGGLELRVNSASFDESDHWERPWSRPGSFVVISVCDNGIGMDEATKAQMFHPFYTTKVPGKGTGLGLSTAFGIVKQHGGFIHVDSEVNKGTTVSVYLPIVAEANTHGGAEPKPEFPGGEEVILFVDDEEAVRGVGKALLEKAGYTVLVAGNGVEALETVRERGSEIDLLMLDVVMPEKGGRAVAEELVDDPLNIPIIFMSGYSGDAVHDELRLDDDESFVQKPYDRKTLLSVVRNRLDDLKPSMF